MWKTPFGVLGVLCLLTPTPSEARITKIEITNTSEPAPDGYITLTGTAYGEVDPTHPLNTIIQDIELAPRNERGMVEYSMDMTIQKPPDGGSGILFYEVVNRGWPMNQMPGRFIGINNLARQRGYTVVTSGWQGDLVKLPDPLQQIIYVPTATDSGTEISGKVRVAYAPAEAASTMLLSSTFGIPMRSYEPVSLSEAGAVLKRYPRNGDSPAVVPREDWAFANCSDTEFPGTPSPMHLCLKEGFSPASMYELVYTGKKPLVLGLGFAATRDLVAFLRHEVADDLGNPNPVAGGMRAALMQGPSQSGFFVRTFLHLGFNLDENQRIVFEGMNPHIGPSRLVLNARFALGAGVDPAQVNRPGWPASPFTLMPVYDPLAKRSGWIFERCLETNSCPKVIQTLSSAEYWQLRASITTTDPLGNHDVQLDRNERVYLFSSSQHGPANEPEFGRCQQLNNPNDYVPLLRALLVALEGWVLEDEEPPPSRYPMLRDGTLVTPDQPSTGWPNIPGVKYTGQVNGATLLDFGPEFSVEDVSGIMRQPPTVITGKDYVLLVPKVDADGNDIAGIRTTTVQAPIGTYTGWNLMREGFGADGLCSLNGSYVPFATTREERETAGDPRPSLEERYADHEGYVEAVREAANQLVDQRFLLQEDAVQIITAAEDSDILVPPETGNQAPIAVITPASQTVVSLEAVLDGSKSHDPDGDPLIYSWKATGTAALIIGADRATARVQFQGGTGAYTFELTVTDDSGATGTASTTVVYLGP